MTAKSLSAFAVGLPAFILIKILASAFYSRQNIARPVKIAFIAMCTNVVLNAILIFPLKLTPYLSQDSKAKLYLRSF